MKLIDLHAAVVSQTQHLLRGDHVRQDPAVMAAHLPHQVDTGHDTVRMNMTLPLLRSIFR